jgi:hypothetical protein
MVSWPHIGVRRVASDSRFEPVLKVLLSINNTSPKLAVGRAIPEQAQLRQRARREAQNLRGLAGGQRNRISRHLSLTVNHPDPPAMSGKLVKRPAMK